MSCYFLNYKIHDCNMKMKHCTSHHRARIHLLCGCVSCRFCSYLILQYKSFAYLVHRAFVLYFLCGCLCQCCTSNTDRTYKIVFVRSSGSRGGFGVCLFICVIKSQAQQGKWKPYNLDKVICWFDMSSRPHRIHTTPTYLQVVAKLEASL